MARICFECGNIIGTFREHICIPLNVSDMKERIEKALALKQLMDPEVKSLAEPCSKCGLLDCRCEIRQLESDLLKAREEIAGLQDAIKFEQERWIKDFQQAEERGAAQMARLSLESTSNPSTVDECMAIWREQKGGG